jgi:hypothetical protein
VRAFAAALIALAAGSTVAAGGSESPAWHPRGAALRGDVDGDGSVESVVLQQRRRSCVFRLKAGSLIARVRPSICKDKPSEVTLPGPDPHVDVLADLDGRPGLEIVLQLGHGAYMEFADIWTYRAGVLRRYSGREPHLSYGSSLGTGTHVVGCSSRAGVVIISDRSYSPRGRVVRHWYRAEDLRLKLIGTKAIVWSSVRYPPFPEFREPQPFATCAKARAPR